MKLTVRYFASLREIVKKKEDSLEFDKEVTVEELLRILSNKYGEKFKEYVYDGKECPKKNLQFLIDGKSITTLNNVKTKLSDGSQFVIIPPVGGGAID